MSEREGIKKARNPAVNISFQNVCVRRSEYSARRSQDRQCCGATHALLCGRCPSDARKGAEPKRRGLGCGQPTNKRAVRVNPEVKGSNFLKDTIKVPLLLASPLDPEMA